LINTNVAKKGTASFAPSTRTLANGTRLFALQLPQARRQVLYAQLAVGSRYEDASTNGLSHFLEHMVFRGTKGYPTAHDVALVFERFGGMLAASTAADVGDFCVGVPAANFEHIVEPFGNVLHYPLFNGIDAERGIVREEILETLDESGNCIDPPDLMRMLAFGDHPLGLPIAGTVSQLDRFDERQLRAHHQRFYVGAGMTVVSVGPLPPEQVLAKLETVFARTPSGERPTSTQPAPQTERRMLFVPNRSSQTQVRVGFRAPACFSGDESAMELLMRILDDGMATRLYHRICDQLGLCYDVAGNYESYLDGGLVELSAETGHSRAPEVLHELLGLMTQLKETAVPPDELRRCQQRFQWQMEAALDNPGELSEYIATESRAQPMRSPQERIEQLSRITAADLQRVAREWFTPQHLNVVVVGTQPKAAQRRLRDIVNGYR
jgi:predicted Zn-dependent peptidase